MLAPGAHVDAAGRLNYSGTSMATPHIAGSIAVIKGVNAFPGDTPDQVVTMTLSGAGTGTTTTDASGNYTFTSLANGTYTITPSKTGYTFSLTSRTVISFCCEKI